ncbi:hypothetical protein V1264_012538 [Littorina saxatilis]
MSDSRTRSRRRKAGTGSGDTTPAKVNKVTKTVQPVSDCSCSSTSQRLDRKFYDVPGEQLARDLLGQNLVRMVDGVRLCARIVETEAYLGAVDKAAHSYRGQTDRNTAMFMLPGTAYVYNVYGMYCCMNISCQGEGCAVLIRAMEPLEGVVKMEELRRGKMKTSAPSAGKTLKVKDLCNGPSKLCQSLAINKPDLNQRDLVTDGGTWLEKGEGVQTCDVVVSARIGIDKAEDWVLKPLRFYVLHNPCVSVRDKHAEKDLQAKKM